MPGFPYICNCGYAGNIISQWRIQTSFRGGRGLNTSPLLWITSYYVMDMGTQKFWGKT